MKYDRNKMKGLATDKQKELLDKLGVGYASSLSKSEASELIEDAIDIANSNYYAVDPAQDYYCDDEPDNDWLG